MPEIDCSVEFEAFCSSCGKGICDHVSTRSSFKRGMPQIVIEPCRKCIDAKDDEIQDLRDQVAELQSQIDSLIK